MNRKKIYITILASVTAAASIISFTTGFCVDTSIRAKDRLRTEISSLEKRRANLDEKKEELSTKLLELETELSSKDTVNNYYMEYQKTHDQLTADITELQKQSSALDEEITKKEAEAEKAGRIKGTIRGKTYSITKDEMYTCPDKIPSGRYIVTGRGTVVIYGTNGKTRVAENLDVSYNNSYTFDLKDKEKFKVNENASLTELK